MRVTYLIPILVFCYQASTQAQMIRSSKDTTAFLENIAMPLAAPNYTMSFMESMLRTDKEKEAPEPIPTEAELLKKLEENPKDAQTAYQLSIYYRDKNDIQNANTYLNHAYKAGTLGLQEHPDSLEFVYTLTNVFQAVGNLEQVLSLWNIYIEQNPKNAEALAQLALYELNVLDTTSARKHIEQAYAIDPSEPVIYIGAMMDQFYRIIIELGGLMDQDYDSKKEKMTALDVLKIDESFFNKAIKEQDSDLPQMGLDGAYTMLLCFRVLLSNLDENLTTKKIKIQVTKTDKQQLQAMQKRAKVQLKSDIKNKNFAHKVLVATYLLLSDMDKAKAAFDAGKDYLEKDIDILRLFSLVHIFNYELPQAIQYLEKSIAIDPTHKEWYALGRLHYLNGNYEKAYDTFENTQGLDSKDYRALLAKVFVLLQEKNFAKATMILDSIDGSIWKTEDQDIQFYDALRFLLKSERYEAVKRLKLVIDNESSDYNEDAKELLKYFDK
ncbi:MAG: hypothetical protein GY810_31950 [Aureispira sp.]|nr:hypothetical protein [Aureispira sp.]